MNPVNLGKLVDHAIWLILGAALIVMSVTYKGRVAKVPPEKQAAFMKCLAVMRFGGIICILMAILQAFLF